MSWPAAIAAGWHPVAEAARLGRRPLARRLLGQPLVVFAGEDGPGGIRFDDFRAAYLVGSLALTAILFEGGLGTERAMLRRAFWPSVALATAGVAISAGVVGVTAVLLFGVSWPQALRAVRAWLEWYNHERPHQALGYLSPHEYRAKEQPPVCLPSNQSLCAA